LAMETTAILRSVLFNLMKSEDVADAIDEVKVMCSKDDIAAVEQQLAEYRQRKTKIQEEKRHG